VAEEGKAEKQKQTALRWINVTSNDIVSTVKNKTARLGVVAGRALGERKQMRLCASAGRLVG